MGRGDRLPEDERVERKRGVDDALRNLRLRLRAGSCLSELRASSFPRGSYNGGEEVLSLAHTVCL